MNIKKIFVFIVTFFAIFILLACGKPDTLEADDSWSETIITIKDEIEQSCAIRPDSVTFVYYTADGQELFTITN